MKKRCATYAVSLIKDDMTIGLGGGSTVGLMVDLLAQSPREITIVTPSFDTYRLCQEKGLKHQELSHVSQIDLAFDGCDELDYDLNALKSGGGIHTHEKLVGSMADEYILLVDQSKYFQELPFNLPVTLEVLPVAVSYVKKSVQALGGQVCYRTSSAKAGVTISDDGNYLLEATFTKPNDLAKLANQLDKIKGLIDHSLFYQVATKAIIASSNQVELIERK
ncbi:ribose-5-phosphate isomerase [Streptococcus penaeicida]|uniref:Ribose 5-phosphate isomerase A n=1 Tax=Streptococcus penaeicida TaxID=1765960 RepID=A0A2N8LAU5_9STRE|nr:ribose 5-phosphate isomerase A [Streptococcus penaeicida]PND47287.1 ribose-5-phosphate isomerase [Streptococcus penaeicida]